MTIATEPVSIPLTRGLVALIDAADFDLVSRYKWWATRLGYAMGYVDRKQLQMHRLLMQPQPGQIVDHINGNRLDNRRENLRLTDYSGNGFNAKRRRDNTSGIPGVRFDGSYWHAYIEIRGKAVNKIFKTQEQAVACRDGMKAVAVAATLGVVA